MVGSLPVAAAALIAARPFTCASVRYRILAGGFAVAAAIGPLALGAAALRPAGSAAGRESLIGGLLSAGAGPALAVLASVATVLLAALAGDVVKLRRVKQRAAAIGRLPVRRALIGTSATVAMPTAIGYVHPAVILPANFRGRVDEREWNAVLAHECAHLARLDDWAKAVQSATVRLGWWIPGLWLLSRALDLERELASDERAACETGARGYAACLLRLATERVAAMAAPGFGGRRSHVAIRVERLLRPSPARSVTMRAAALGVFTAVGVAIVTAAVFVLPGMGPSAVAPPPVLTVRTDRGRHATPSLAEHRAQRPVQPRRDGVRGGALAAGRTAHVNGRRAAIVAARPPAHRAPRAVKRAAAAMTIALIFRRPHCPTCFGPLHTSDDAVGLGGVSIRSGSTASGTVAAAPDDASSGPVSLSSDAVWLRLPARSITGE